MAVSLDKPLEWAVGFFFANIEPSMELWMVIAGTPMAPSGQEYWDSVFAFILPEAAIV